MFAPRVFEIVPTVEKHHWVIVNTPVRSYFEGMETKKYRTKFNGWDITVVVHAERDLSEAELILLKRLLTREVLFISQRRLTWIILIDLNEYSMTPARAGKR